MVHLNLLNIKGLYENKWGAQSLFKLLEMGVPFITWFVKKITFNVKLTGKIHFDFHGM